MSSEDGPTRSMDATLERALERVEHDAGSLPGRFRYWFLLTGNRLVVTAFMLLLVFLAILAMTVARPLDMQQLVTETSAARDLFRTMLRGSILLVSIVVSINSVVLSQEITDLESQEERVEASVEYRKHIEGLIEAEISPARPDDFLTAILVAIWRETEALESIAEHSGDQTFARRWGAFADKVAADVTHARGQLAREDSATFDVLLAGMDFDYSVQLRSVRRFKREYGDDLPAEAREQLDALVDTLEYFAVAHEYFKSLYYKRELARLSSRLLFVSLPVIVFTSYVVLALSTRLLPDVSLFGISPLLVFVTFAYTVSLAPFLVLTAYIVRLAVITLRTLTAGPFVLSEGNRGQPIEWGEADDAVSLKSVVEESSE